MKGMISRDGDTTGIWELTIDRIVPRGVIHPLLPIAFQLPDASETFHTPFFCKTQFDLYNVKVLNYQTRLS
jgi:hypothetical protein